MTGRLPQEFVVEHELAVLIGSSLFLQPKPKRIPKKVQFFPGRENIVRCRKGASEQRRSKSREIWHGMEVWHFPHDKRFFFTPKKRKYRMNSNVFHIQRRTHCWIKSALMNWQETARWTVTPAVKRPRKRGMEYLLPLLPLSLSLSQENTPSLYGSVYTQDGERLCKLSLKPEKNNWALHPLLFSGSAQ